VIGLGYVNKGGVEGCIGVNMCWVWGEYVVYGGACELKCSGCGW
jgi:hypothetical protein